MTSGFKQILKMTLLLFVFSLFSSAVFGQAVDRQPIERMYIFAGSTLQKILNYIPVNKESDYGFSNRDEFKKAGLGIPYQEYEMSTGFPTGYWRVAVTVDGENRALLRLFQVDSQWQFAGFGGAKLARELAEFEKVVGKGKPVSGRIIRDFRMYCDFVQFDRQPGKQLDGLLYPLESAARVLLNAGVATTLGYEGYPVEKIRELRAAFKKAPGENDSAEVK